MSLSLFAIRLVTRPVTINTSDCLGDGMGNTPNLSASNLGENNAISSGEQQPVTMCMGQRDEARAQLITFLTMLID
jgi:hypothetical protein